MLYVDVEHVSAAHRRQQQEQDSDAPEHACARRRIVNHLPRTKIGSTPWGHVPQAELATAAPLTAMTIILLSIVLRS